MKNINERKTAKGYRLKPETHKMIRNIQNLLRGDLDHAIYTACKKFLSELKQNNNQRK